MKKIITFIACAFISIIASAETTTGNDKVYIKDLVVGKDQGTAYLNVNVIADTRDLGAVSVEIQLPDGFTVDEDNIPSNCMAYNAAYTSTTQFFIFTGGTSQGSESTEALIPVKFDGDNVTIGQKLTVKLASSSVAFKDASGQYDFETALTSSITVQRAEVANNMGAANNIEIIPFKLTANTTENKVPLLMTSTNAIGSVDFDIYLPDGITWSMDGVDYMEADLNDEYYNREPNQNISKNTDGSIHVQFYKSNSSYYFIEGLSAAPIATLYFDGASTLADGVYEVKLKNIKLDEKTAGGSYSGEYFFSIFVGTPTEADPIVYGHYTSDAQTVLKNASTNFASVDMHSSSTTVDALTEAQVSKSLLPQILVYGHDYTSYYRAIGSTYGTVCVPFELTSDDKNTYYELDDVKSDEYLFFKKVDKVEANVPAIFTGNLELASEGYWYADTPGKATEVMGYTLTGTYEKLTDVNCAYIRNDKFYSDYATVAPFRAYFPDATPGKAFNIVVEDETGIHNITDQLSDDAIYSIQGIRMQNAQKGVNIIGGKKVYIKK